MTATVGTLLREWRQRRRLSQLQLAVEAEVSTRHLSFVESGRARPSRAMLLHLAEQLDIPLRERNLLLVAGGFAPAFPHCALDDPALAAARQAIRQVLAAQEPYPAIAVDRYWTLVDANRVAYALTDSIEPSLLEPPINMLRLTLHPDGLAPHIANLAEWRAHLLARLRRQIELTADPQLMALLDEMQQYPAPRGGSPHVASDELALAVPFQIRWKGHLLSFFGTIMLFGTPVDVTLSELAIESLFPANAETAAAMQRMWQEASAPTTI